MNRLEPLPALWNSLLDAETLNQYFADLTQHASIISISEKQRTEQYAGSEHLDLPAAREHFFASSVGSLQIRYQYDDCEWCDTLIRQGGLAKLIRMQVQQTHC